MTTTQLPQHILDTIERSKVQVERHLVERAALEEQHRLLQPAPVVPPAAHVDSAPQRTSPPKEVPLIEVKESDIISLLSGYDELPDSSEKGVERVHNFFKPVNMTLLDHLNREKGGVQMYFSYPQSFEERVKKVWKHFKRELDIRPIGNPDTRRFGPSARIQFPCPLNIECLREYPKAYERGEKILATARPGVSGGVIVMYDVRLALQLCFQYGFNLEGSPYEPLEDIGVA